MTAQIISGDVLHLEDAYAYLVDTSLTPCAGGRVGLELELHLVDLEHPARRPTWARIQAAVAGLPPMPSGSSVTLEPGGQIELSTPPRDDVASSIAALQADRAVLRDGLRAAGFGAAALGADPARPTDRVNPASRYRAMEQHFAALGCADAGRAMMTATAALQVNLDAGPAAGWGERLGLIRALGPVLIAVSACSPYLAGRSSGWRSMRQETWHGIDHRRSDPVAGAEPTLAWASYALQAPVMLVRDGAHSTPVTRRVTFREWVLDAAAFGRPATLADLDYHLTTLFPPVRPRGYVEIRCIDAAPDRWWPALAALAATIVDVPAAADLAREALAPVAGEWTTAARDGVGDPALRRAALACLDLAAAHGPLADDLQALAALVEAGRSPGDDLRARCETSGPLAVLEEAARA